jgi:MoxR-like ATPase
VPGLVDQIAPALAQHIENAATAVSVTPYARFHSTAAAEYVGTATGRDLPTPEHRDLPKTPGKSGWDGFVAWAARVFDEERFDAWERNYKLAIAERLRAARAALEADSDDWWQLLKVAFTKDNNLTPWQQHSKFYQWAKDEPEAAKTALRAIWAQEAEVEQRIRTFCDALPKEVVGGTGTRLAIASFLLMVDPTSHPIFRPTPFQEAWRLTGWDGPPNDADEADTYDSALGFTDELRDRLAQSGVQTRDRLDAQGLIFAVVHWTEPPQYLTPEERKRIARFKAGEVDVVPPVPDIPSDTSRPIGLEGYTEPSFDEVLDQFQMAGFRIDADTLLRYRLSLKTRGFVILSGVSGTGKSWLTRLYADAVGGEFRLVPVAPNWTTNEDLLGFYNPVTGKYVDTDFSRFLRLAVSEQERADEAGVTPRPFFVVLDEMNLARVEYYFAKFLSVMEARNLEGVAIELSADERLPLPPNLYAVGTVNVDETTHGFADKVYDRAQVIELPISDTDLQDHIGPVSHAASLMAMWRAVEPVAPFAYRVADEVARYVAAAADAGIEWEQALDHQILQKVLPKLARADDRVGEVLLEVQAVCGEALPLSAAKAAAMHQNLEDHGFASYF